MRQTKEVKAILKEAKAIKLTQNKEALVDDEDFLKLNKHKWYAQRIHKSIYAVRAIGKKKIYMHQDVMKSKKGQMIDHLDRNGLNNQKSNLRFCTYSENNKNRNAFGESKYKGVTIIRQGDRIYYKAEGWLNGKNLYIGLYRTEIEASNAYILKQSEFTATPK